MGNEDKTIEILTQLKNQLETCCKRKMTTPKDFDFLSESIYLHTHQMVNSSTLKRLFGYVGREVFPRNSTLDILCQYIGYTSWNVYQQNLSSESDAESNPIVGTHLYSDELHVGETLRILWQPDRELSVRHDGNGRFTIIESKNSKLKEGCTFCCYVFIQDEPLYLTDVVGLASAPVDYVCGKSNGVKVTSVN